MRPDVLIERLANHEKLRSLLDEMPAGVATELVESLWREFDSIIDRYSLLTVYAGALRKPSKKRAPAPITANTPADNRGNAPLSTKPIKIQLPLIDVHETERRVLAKQAEEARERRLRHELEQAEQLIRTEIERDWEGKAAGLSTHTEHVKTSQQLLRQDVPVPDGPEEEVEGPLPPPSPQFDFTEDDLLYLHGAGLADAAAQDTQPVDSVRGIDDTGPVYMLHHDAVKLFVSKIQREELNVTRSGMLLLNKEDSLRYREVHESILNELRCEESLVPFEFGTIVRGKVRLEGVAGSLAADLPEVCETEAAAGIWTVKMLALDARVGASIAGTSPAARMQERGRDTKRPAKRSDVKTLEKILQQERLIAESVHAVLATVSTSTELASLIGVGSGTSEDWKLILEATYAVPIINRSKFFVTLIELQQEYRGKGMMLEVHGAAGRLNITDPQTRHAASA